MGAASMLKTAVPATATNAVACVTGFAPVPESGVEALLRGCEPMRDAAMDSVAPGEKASDKTDKAMSLVGKETCNRLPGGSAKQLKAAKDVAKELSNRLSDLPPPPVVPCAVQDADAVGVEMSSLFSQASWPSIGGARAMLWVLDWMQGAEEVTVAALDAAGGLPPSSWVSGLREAAAKPAWGGKGCLPRLVAQIVPGVDASAVARAAVAAAVKWRSNSDFRTVHLHGWRELWRPLAAEELLARLTDELEASRGEMWAAVVEAARMRSANAMAAAAPNLHSFLGYVTWFHQGERGRHFNHLMELLADPAVQCPERGDKVRVLVTGKLEGEKVLDRGNAFMPSAAMCGALEGVLGEEVWMGIEVQLRTVQANHTYRCACDVVAGVACYMANRHGHCNGNPHVLGGGRDNMQI